MSEFDPYHQWLGIPVTERPISKYRLLAIADFESDRGVISTAGERQTVFLRTMQAGEHAELVAELLNEVSQARVTLLNADQKTAYDEELRKQQTPAPVPDPTPLPIPVVQTPSPTPVGVRGTVTQEFPVSIVQPAKIPRRKRQKEIWKQPAVMGISVVGAIGVLVLFISQISPGDAEPVASNTPPVVTSPPIPRPEPKAPQPETPPTIPPQPEPEPEPEPANTLPASLQEGLVAYYPFNGNAKDESGNGNHGEVSGATIDADRYGNESQAYSFDGSNDYISASGDFPQGSSPRTLTFWARPTKTTGSENIVGWGQSAQGKAFGGYAAHDEGRNGLLFYGHGDDCDFSANFAVNSKWHKYSIVHNGQMIHFFVDGNETARHSAQNINTTGNSLIIGARIDLKYPFTGPIDDIRIYNRALSAAEVKALYEFESKPPVPPTAPATESITNTIGMTLNKIPAGTFLMGSPETEKNNPREDEHQHQVTITKAFYMQTTEVTQGQWKALMGTEPWKGHEFSKYVKEGANYPATLVSWDDAVAYCEKLSEKESKTYRLPTEAEWEYACRAGTKTIWSFGNDKTDLGDYAWYDKNTWDIDEKYAHQVGLKRPNPWGLYDMHGNVYEWCHDYYEANYYKQSPEKDPPGPTSVSVRVLRGGSWDFHTRLARSANRMGATLVTRGLDGFRLVRELDDSTQSTPPTSPVPVDPPIIELPSITNTIGMTLNKIPAGTFMIGSPESEPDREIIETQRKVTITNPFYMQTTEVTQGQWMALMGTEPWKGKSYVKEGSDYAASYVSWDDAVAFCKKLNEKEGKTYRLPTEAEWEYACRAGTKTIWSFGNDNKDLGDYAWYDENADDIDEKYAHQVGLKRPNPWGLYDMHGNAWEWCHDFYGVNYYKQSSEKDPTGPTSGSKRVLRGGSWCYGTRGTRSACRGRGVAGYRYDVNYGFRLVRELD